MSLPENENPLVPVPYFCTGKGSHDTLIDAGGMYLGISFDQIVELANNPPSVPKDEAQWFIPSVYREYDARTHDGQRKFGTFWALAGDVDNSDLSAEALLEAIQKTLGGQYQTLIYSSRSATQTLRKWRFIIPLAKDIRGEDYTDTQDALFQYMERYANGSLMLDHSLRRAGQLIHLPNRGDHYEAYVIDGPRFNLTPDTDLYKQRDGLARKLWRAPTEEPGGVLWETGTGRRWNFGVKRCGWR